ncbi:MAG: hypothetical protein M9913_08835 [Bryobacteraceae bacterium]|nr:hypothetical protein [Solibacteraceae bacterium]MCO5350990.1 hypothetical protein [Bryobacteraceae bacterium]
METVEGVAFRVRNALLALVGVAGLVMKGGLGGPQAELVHNHGGNVAGSFAVYFVMANPCRRLRRRRLVTAAVALAVVNLFEATDGFGVMANTYDPADYVANGVGTGLALVVDWVVSRVAAKRAERD